MTQSISISKVAAVAAVALAATAAVITALHTGAASHVFGMGSWS